MLHDCSARYKPYPVSVTDRRDELVAAATVWVLEHGLSGLSLRPLAKALGTSDRMLMYYFGSRDGLVAAISDFAGQQLVAAMPAIDPAHPPRSAKVWLDGAWALFSDDAIRPAMQLLFELDALAARSPGPARDAAAAVTARWLSVVDDALAALGVATRRRRELTPVIAAAMVGLALEHLVVETSSGPAALRALARIIDDARAGS